MTVFKTNLEVIFASEEEVELYYQAAAKKINLLLEKYNVCNAKNEFKKVSVDQLKALLSFAGFFQSTPLKTIFFGQQQQFVPQEIVHAFRSIISDPPVSIKAVFFNTFITLLAEKGWDKPLRAYFEKQYACALDGDIILDDLKDYSLSFGVYRVTFQLRTPRREKVIIFLKKSRDVSSYNELLYFHLQKELLPTASPVKLPCRLPGKENKEALLLSPLIFGFASDTILTMLMQAYRKTENNDHKFNLKNTLEILIEAFIHHAVLGDLLGRNDRHLMNSLMAFVVNGVPQKPTEEEFNNPEKFLVYAENILSMKTKAISLVDIDLHWLLGEKNTDWMLADIDFGLSELNLLSLLAEFNDYNSTTNTFFEKRKKYIAHYFNLYCQQQAAFLEKKSLLFTAVKKIYPTNIAEKKLKLLVERINFFEKSKEPVVELFKRYLLNFRIRLVYKATLVELEKIANETENMHLLNALKETDLLKYLPSRLDFVSYESSVFLQLQCFRGVLAKKDMVTLLEKDETTWETVASNIAMVAEKFNSTLFKTLEDKKQFITEDTAALLKAILPLESNAANVCFN